MPLSSVSPAQVLDAVRDASRSSGSRRAPLGAIFDRFRKHGIDQQEIGDIMDGLVAWGWIELHGKEGKSTADRLKIRDVQAEVTPKGTIAGRDLGASRQFNVRLPGSLARELRNLAQERGTTPTTIALELIEEGARLARHPGIYFRSTPSGRRPHVSGTGVTVWEMEEVLDSYKGVEGRMLSDYKHLKSAQVQAARGYAAAHPEERPPEAAIPPGIRKFRVKI